MSWKYNPFTGHLDKVNSGAGSSPWITVSETVAATTTGVVDSVANGMFQSIKYIITVFSQADTAYKTFEFNVLNNDGSYKDVQTHRLQAGGLSMNVDTVNNAGTMELQITNNESYSVNVELAKLILT